MNRERTGVTATGIAIVLAVHGAALWGLWAHRLIPTPQKAGTLFVDFIAPPPPPRVEQAPKRKPPAPRREDKPPPRQLLAEAPAVPVAELAVPPAPTPVISAPLESKPAAPAGPVTLATELAVSCPERSAPNYPPLSRRMGAAGTTVLRVELDEQGHVAAARVATGSGFALLDEAALTAVKTWRCNPAQRNGRPVRAVALQAFKFILQGS